MRFIPICAVLALAACPSVDSAAVKRAHDARYQGDPTALLEAAAEATKAQHYLIDELDRDGGAFTTVDKVWSAEGETESVGNGDAIQVHNKSIFLAYVVRLVPADPGYQIEIEPHIRRYVADHPNLDDVKLDDPTLPGWVPVKIDELSVGIHDALATYEIKTPAP